MNPGKAITLFAPAQHAATWRWVVDDTVDQGELAELAGRLGGKRSQIDLMVPADVCLITRIDLPRGRRRDQQQALPFVLEEQLAGEPGEDYLAHAAVAENDPMASDTDTVVAAINRARLDSWLEELEAHGLRPDRICPDALSVPWQQGAITILELNEHCLLRWQQYSGTRCQPAELSAWLELIDPEQSMAVIWQGKRPINEFGRRTVQYREPDNSPHLDLARHSSQNPLDWAADNPALRGVPERSFSWKPPLLAAAALIGALLIWQLAGLWQLSERAETLQAEIETQMADAFPGITTRVQGREGDQAMNALSQRRGMAGGQGSDFLTLLDAATRNWPEEVDLLGLDLSEGQLSLDVEAGAAAELDALKNGLERQGLTAELASVSLADGRARAWLRLRETDRG